MEYIINRSDGNYFCQTEDIKQSRNVINYKLYFYNFNNIFFILQIFRHGDRTPSKEEIYPKLPYNPIYDTLGYGQLTEVNYIQ